ncbi:MAG: polymer-forming cytoskeletal protein [Desulfobacteraceae bacterium]|nr:polymer-forming cytoskeletal protein [Desulfobacteraceae bacterium]
MNKKNLSIIDRELTIEGSISSSGKLIIKGKIKGEIKGDIIVIAEDGEVDSSSAIVVSMTVGGKFNGDVIASKELIILSTGSCSGKVECKDLIVENGGVLNAEVSCTTSSQAGGGKQKEKIELAKKEMKVVKKIEL